MAKQSQVRSVPGKNNSVGAEIFGAIKAELYIISHRYYDETGQGISTKQDTGGGLPEQTE